MRRLAALLLACITALLCCTGCGKGGEDENKGAGHSFSYTLVGNPDTLDPQLAVSASAKTVLANLFEGLLKLDADGTLQNGVAESYTVSDDQLHYYFKLRSDCYWYDAKAKDGEFGDEAKRAVSAMDFVYAFQRIFDPVYQSPYRDMYACLANAKEISEGQLDPSMIGVYAHKEDELEFELSYPNTGFLLLLTATAALPCNADYFAETGGRYGLDEDSVIGNGSFALQRWLYDPYGKYNVVQMVRNPLNHAVRRVYPVDLNFFIEDQDSDAARIFTEGSADCYVSTNSNLITRTEYSAAGAHSITLGLIPNPDSQFADASMLQALSLSLDRSSIHPEGDDIITAGGIIPPAADLLNKSCRELISDGAYNTFNWEAADQAYQKALRHLRVSEPDDGHILVPAGMMDYTALKDITDQWGAMLGVHLVIEEVTEQEYDARLNAKDYTLALYTVTGEYHDAASVLESFISDDVLHCSAEKKVRNLLKEAASAPNLTDCVELYRQAEAAILEDNCFIPLFYKKRYLVCKRGVSDVVFNPFSGQVTFDQAKYDDSET